MANKYLHLQRAIQAGRRKAKMCSNKVGFESANDAYQKGQRQYKCPYCGKWHRSGALSRFVASLK